MPFEKTDPAKVIDLLVKLQSVAEDAFHLQEKRDRFITLLTKAKKNVETNKKEYAQSKEEIKNMTDDIQEKQNIIQNFIDEIKKLKEKEKMVKTQKEYIALDTEQSIRREHIQEIEKEIAGKNKKLVDLNQKQEKQQKIYKEQEKQLKETEEDTKLELSDIEDKLKDSENIRIDVIPEIDPIMLGRFERIVKNKNGIGIVPIISSICTGCNIAVTPHVISQVKRKEEIIYCINCARILYLPERTSIF